MVFGNRNQPLTTSYTSHMKYNRGSSMANQQGVFFNIEKAFKRQHLISILNSLAKLNLHGNIYHFVANFLSSRVFRVRVGKHLSTLRAQEVGTPQGSVLSPRLFIIDLNSIPSLLKYPVQHSLFADDLAIFIRGPDLQFIQWHLQDSIDWFAHWGELRGLKFSTEKTKIVNFNRKRSTFPVVLTLSNKTPPPSTGLSLPRANHRYKA